MSDNLFNSAYREWPQNVPTCWGRRVVGKGIVTGLPTPWSPCICHISNGTRPFQVVSPMSYLISPGRNTCSLRRSHTPPYFWLFLTYTTSSLLSIFAWEMWECSLHCLFIRKIALSLSYDALPCHSKLWCFAVCFQNTLC